MSDEKFTQSEPSPTSAGCAFQLLLPLYVVGGMFFGMLAGMMLGSFVADGNFLRASDLFFGRVEGNEYVGEFLRTSLYVLVGFFPATSLALLVGWLGGVIASTFETVSNRRAYKIAFCLSLASNATFLTLAIADKMSCFGLN